MNKPIPPKPPPPPPMHQPVATPSMPVYCPHCQREIQIHSQHAGQVVECPHCRGRLQSPVPQAAPGRLPPGYYPVAQVHTGVKICVLISAISNILAGLVWISTICGIVIGVPQIILAIFEFIYFAQADTKPVHESHAHAKVIGILEIIAGLFNAVSLVCGILVLVFASTKNP